MTTTVKSPPPSSSRESSLSLSEEDSDVSHKRELPGDVHEDPRVLNVADNPKNEFPDTSTGKKPQKGKHRESQRAPTARQGSGAGSSAAKRIRQTRLREKAQGKSNKEK